MPSPSFATSFAIVAFIYSFLCYRCLRLQFSSSLPSFAASTAITFVRSFLCHRLRPQLPPSSPLFATSSATSSVAAFIRSFPRFCHRLQLPPLALPLFVAYSPASSATATFFRLLADQYADHPLPGGISLLGPSCLPSTLTPLLVLTSLADLIVKNHSHLKKPSRKKLSPFDLDSSTSGPM
ncbi:hypothetical protein GW17_00013120 [Ensete ventricosum]|nr:hypothetical protein GW17_00013120 [Ensete ventricosum]